MAKAEATDRMVTVASPSASASAMAAAATPERVRRGVGPREPCSGRSQMLGDPFRVTARHGLDQAGRGRHPRLWRLQRSWRGDAPRCCAWSLWVRLHTWYWSA